MDGVELRRLQNDDDTLISVWKAAEGKTESEPDGTGFFERDGLLYQRWVPVGGCMGDVWRDIGIRLSYQRSAVPANYFTSCTHHSFCRSPGKEKDCHAGPKPVLLANTV